MLPISDRYRRPSYSNPSVSTNTRIILPVLPLQVTARRRQSRIPIDVAVLLRLVVPPTRSTRSSLGRRHRTSDVCRDLRGPLLRMDAQSTLFTTLQPPSDPANQILAYDDCDTLRRTRLRTSQQLVDRHVVQLRDLQSHRRCHRVTSLIVCRFLNHRSIAPTCIGPSFGFAHRSNIRLRTVSSSRAPDDTAQPRWQRSCSSLFTHVLNLHRGIRSNPDASLDRPRPRRRTESRGSKRHQAVRVKSPSEIPETTSADEVATAKPHEPTTQRPTVADPRREIRRPKPSNALPTRTFWNESSSHRDKPNILQVTYAVFPNTAAQAIPPSPNHPSSPSHPHEAARSTNPTPIAICKETLE